MKKVIILMIVCAFLFAGCAPLQDSPVPLDTVVAKAQVVDMKNGLLVIGLDDYLQGLCSVGIGDTELPADITPGDEIAITFDGMVAESYPCQISNVTDIKIIQKNPMLSECTERLFWNLETLTPHLIAMPRALQSI